MDPAPPPVAPLDPPPTPSSSAPAVPLVPKEKKKTRTRYTEEEDEAILAGVKIHGRCWKLVLGHGLGVFHETRKSTDISTRYSLLLKKTLKPSSTEAATTAMDIDIDMDWSPDPMDQLQKSETVVLASTTPTNGDLDGAPSSVNTSTEKFFQQTPPIPTIDTITTNGIPLIGMPIPIIGMPSDQFASLFDDSLFPDVSTPPIPAASPPSSVVVLTSEITRLKKELDEMRNRLLAGLPPTAAVPAAVRSALPATPPLPTDDDPKLTAEYSLADLKTEFKARFAKVSQKTLRGLYAASKTNKADLLRILCVGSTVISKSGRMERVAALTADMESKIAAIKASVASAESSLEAVRAPLVEHGLSALRELWDENAGKREEATEKAAEKRNKAKRKREEEEAEQGKKTEAAVKSMHIHSHPTVHSCNLAMTTDIEGRTAGASCGACGRDPCFVTCTACNFDLCKPCLELSDEERERLRAAKEEAGRQQQRVREEAEAKTEREYEEAEAKREREKELPLTAQYELKFGTVKACVKSPPKKNCDQGNGLGFTVYQGDSWESWGKSGTNTTWCNSYASVEDANARARFLFWTEHESTRDLDEVEEWGCDESFVGKGRLAKFLFDKSNFDGGDWYMAVIPDDGFDMLRN